MLIDITERKKRRSLQWENRTLPMRNGRCSQFTEPEFHTLLLLLLLSFSFSFFLLLSFSVLCVSCSHGAFPSPPSPCLQYAPFLALPGGVGNAVREGLSSGGGFDGTVFRMSLRTKPGEISGSKCTVDAVEREVMYSWPCTGIVKFYIIRFSMCRYSLVLCYIFPIVDFLVPRVVLLWRHRVSTVLLGWFGRNIPGFSTVVSGFCLVSYTPFVTFGLLFSHPHNPYRRPTPTPPPSSLLPFVLAQTLRRACVGWTCYVSLPARGWCVRTSSWLRHFWNALFV